jgi:hypothetical protein
MPTVDDLTISLTIKETSKLGQLQKQLEALVGKKGEKAPIIGLDPTMKADLTYIKRELALIAPATIPGKGNIERMAHSARKLINWIDKQDIKSLASRIIPQDQSKREEMARELGVTIDDLEDTLSKRVETYIKALQMVGGKLTTAGRWSQDLLDAWMKMQRIGPEMPETERKMIFNSFQKAIKENNELMLEFFKKKGIKAFHEAPKFRKFSESFRRKVYESKKTLARTPEGEPMIREEIYSSYLLPLKETREEAKEYAMKMRGIVSDSEDTVDVFNKVAKNFKLTSEQAMEMFMATEKEIKTKPFLQAIASTLFKVAWEKKGGVPLEYAKYFKNIMTALWGKMGGKQFKEMNIRGAEGIFDELRKVDFTLLGTTTKKLIEAGLPKTAEAFKKLGEPFIHFLEQKDIAKAGRTTVGELKEYREVYGEKHISLFADAVRTDLKDMFPNITMEALDTWGSVFAERIIIPPLKSELEEISRDEEKQKEAYLEKLVKETGVSKEILEKNLNSIEKLIMTEKKESFLAVPAAIMMDIMEMKEKSKKMGINLFDVMEDFIGKFRLGKGEEEEGMFHKERERLLKKLVEIVPKSIVAKKIAEERKALNLEDVELLKELKQEISNVEIWKQLKDVLKLTEKGSTEREQIMSLVKGFLTKKKPDVERTEPPGEF